MNSVIADPTSLWRLAEAAHSTWRGLQGIHSTAMLPLAGCMIQSLPYPVPPLAGHDNARGTLNVRLSGLSVVQDLTK